MAEQQPNGTLGVVHSGSVCFADVSGRDSNDFRDNHIV